ncbi:MAG TPA: universal stress protein [Candidatus Synoicihabitans sp.]|nr:universal stress protein [Candidatus Synoicihabitans sp.]
MPTILSCTDGSRYARSVYEHTAWAARRLDAAVHVLHIIEGRREVAAMADLSGAIGVDAQQKLTEELVALEEAKARVAQKHARAILADARQQLTAAGVPRIEVEATHGELIDSIERFEASVDLVVVGKRGEHADLAKLHLGGNLQRVIRSAHHPVLVASRAFVPIERFLIAYDGSPSVLKAVEFVRRSPLLRGLPCHILRAGKIDDQACYFLEEAAGKLRDAGFTVSSQATAGPADEVIAAAVTERRINLLVMGAYGHSRIPELILGSTTTTMVRTCLVPVLMFR